MSGESAMHHNPTVGNQIRNPAVSDRMDRDGAGAGDYEQMWKRSLADPEAFWAKEAESLVSWSQKWTKVLSSSGGMASTRWFPGGRLNVAYNCLDRHLELGRNNKAAIIWQGDADHEVRVYTYQMLHTEVCRFAKVLTKFGVGVGDRVILYLPMIPELVVAMLACARIGAIHSVVFAGFSAMSLRQRIEDCGAKTVVTADHAVRGGRILPLKDNVDEALSDCRCVQTCVVVRRTDGEVAMRQGRDVWYHREIRATDLNGECPAREMAAEDPLFILYTSGATGSPKGVVHCCGGYFVYALSSCRQVFAIGDEDTYWCTADIGWITGHTCTVYGPLGLGATTLIFEGIPSYPGPDRFWQIVEKYRVTVFYTAPTVIRALMRYGNEPADIHDLTSLRLLGSVGEPLNPDTWRWYHRIIGQGRLPIMDTWWQTETGGIMLAPRPYPGRTRAGSGARPLPGIDAAVLDENGVEAGPNENGSLVIRRPWPGMFAGWFGDERHYLESYFQRFSGKYDTGDSACRDGDGNFRITGRHDDVMNVSGHRIGTAEVESALVTHPCVAETAVVAVPHPIKGEAIYAYITIKENISKNIGLIESIKDHVRRQIGAIAVPEVIQCASKLPKTRSGKIMRRVLRKIAAEEFDDFGDTSALADASVIEELIAGKKVGAGKR